MTELQDLLSGLKGEMGDGKLPTVKEMWRAGDLEPKLEKLNRSINLICRRWQVHTTTERDGRRLTIDVGTRERPYASTPS
jgi:hypothetical protein